MTNELTRPLGLKPQRTAGARKHGRTAFLAAGLLIAAGLGAGAGYLLLGGNGSRPGSVPTEIAANPSDNSASANTGDERAEEPPISAEPEEEGDFTGMAETSPDGSIEPQLPVPTLRRQEAGLAHLPDPELIERGATGVIPKRGSDGVRPMDAYSRPPETEGNFGVARVVIIVGGLGISQTSTLNAIEQLPPAVTLAFAPYGNSLSRWMQKARKQGHELLLQVPMEPFGYPQSNPGAHTLRSDVSADENIANLHWVMSRITNYVGVVNFLGGKFLADQTAMRPILDEIRDRGLLFIDDGSVKNSVSDSLAAAARLPFAKAHIHLDAINERRAIAQRLDELKQQAQRTGMAIGVASAFPESVALIAEFARNAANESLEVTPVSAVVDDPERPDSD